MRILNSEKLEDNLTCCGKEVQSKGVYKKEFGIANV